MPSLLHPPLPAAQCAPALAPALRLGAQPGAGRSRRVGHAAVPGHRARRARAGPAARGARLLPRRRARHPRAARLGSAALRCVLAAPGHHFRAPRGAGRAAAAEVRGTAGRGRYAGPATRAARLRRRPHFQSRRRRSSCRIEPLRARLVESGYASVSQVTAPGEFALRGSLFDVFPMGAKTPLRVDLFDDEIEAIREFDPETQRSGASLKQVRLLPGRELPLDADSVKAFRLRYRKRFEGDPTTQRDLSRRQRRPGAAGHRVLPAAVLRYHRYAARLSTAGHGGVRGQPTSPARWNAPRA